MYEIEKHIILNSRYRIVPLEGHLYTLALVPLQLKSTIQRTKRHGRQVTQLSWKERHNDGLRTSATRKRVQGQEVFSLPSATKLPYITPPTETFWPRRLALVMALNVITFRNRQRSVSSSS